MMSMHRDRWRLGPWLSALLVAGLCLATTARAATVIRDAEIEETIRTIADPIFIAARLSPEVIDVYLIRDDSLNAFVAGGQNLFLNTGLVIRTENPDQLAGVIAHETGHIAGGHLSRTAQAAERATMESLLGAVLGAAAAAVGAPEVGTAIMAGGATVAQSGILAFSRSQEEAADQAAVTFLETTGRSPRGLVEFFGVLDSQNLGIGAGGSVFLRTHPLTRDRMRALQAKLDGSPLKDLRSDPELALAHARIVAKLEGFLSRPDTVLARRTGNSLPDRYARTVAYFRQADLERALSLVDGLIAEAPDDPWFHELKGQMLFESGRIAAAEGPYRTALRLRPTAPLLRIGLAGTLSEQGGEARLREAAALLKEAVRLEPENSGAWRALGVAQGQLGAEGEAALALTEAAVLGDRKRDAELYLRRAQAMIPHNDAAYMRVLDLERAVEEMEEERPPSPRRR
jgi:predicted Zn-dependent protease